jgi:hypothetical protein
MWQCWKNWVCSDKFNVCTDFLAKGLRFKKKKAMLLPIGPSNLLLLKPQGMLCGKGVQVHFISSDQHVMNSATRSTSWGQMKEKWLDKKLLLVTANAEQIITDSEVDFNFVCYSFFHYVRGSFDLEKRISLALPGLELRSLRSYGPSQIPIPTELFHIYIYIYIYIFQNWISWFRIAMGLTAGVRFPVGARFSSLHWCTDRFWDPSSLLSNGYRGSFLPAWIWPLTCLQYRDWGWVWVWVLCYDRQSVGQFILE